MKKKIIIILLTILLIITVSIITINFANNSISIRMQVIRYDILNDSQKIVKRQKIKKGDIINLNRFDGNDITILEINETDVKFSRNAIRYEILNQDLGSLSGETRKYTETIVENVKYNKLIDMNIDSKNPFSPAESQSRYHYSIKFVK